MFWGKPVINPNDTANSFTLTTDTGTPYSHFLRKVFKDLEILPTINQHHNMSSFSNEDEKNRQLYKKESQEKGVNHTLNS
jgi:hypothetical protein